MARTTSTSRRYKPYVLRQIEGSGGGPGPFAPSPHDLSSAHHTGQVADSQAPQFLKTDGSRQLVGNQGVADGITIDGVDLSAFKSTFDTHKAATAHVGHTAGVGIHTHQTNPEGGLLDHGLALTGLGDDDHTIYASAEGSGTRRAYEAGRLNKSILAGSGLTGGGLLTADRTLACDWDTSTPQDVSLAAGSAGSTAKPARSDHRHVLSQSIVPTWAGLHTFGAGLVSNDDLRVGANILFVDVSQTNVGINCAPDTQFDLDILGNLRAQGWIVGKHAIQLEGAMLIAHYDGPRPLETNFTGEPTGHMGQKATTAGGVIYCPGKFGKAVQVAPGAINLLKNPSFETNLDFWTFANGSGGSRSQSAEKSRYGSYSMKVSTGGPGYCYNIHNYVAVSPSTVYAVSAYMAQVSGSGSATLRVWEYDSGYNYVGAFPLQTFTSGAHDWERVIATATTQVSTAYLIVVLEQGDGSDDAVCYWDAAQIEENADATPYLDGSLGPGHSWSGAAHASTSTRTGAVLTYPVSGNIKARAGSVSLWVYCDAPNPNGGLLWCAGNANAELDAYFYSTSIIYRINGTAITCAMTVKAWHHTVFTWDTDANSQKLYVDGQEGASGSVGDEPTLGATIGVGYSPALGSTIYDANGLIDDFVVLDRALSADEVRAIYESNAPVFAETSSWSWHLPTNLAWADSEGLWAISADGNAAFGVSGVAGKSWGGKTLDAGDVLLGRSASYALWDASAGILEVKGTIKADAGEFAGVLSIGVAGGIFQGTGTFAAPTTALKVYNSGGIGLLEMWGSGTKKVYMSTTGDLMAAGGNMVFNDAGQTITVDLNYSDARSIRFLESGGPLVSQWRALASPTLHTGQLRVRSPYEHTANLELAAEIENASDHAYASLYATVVGGSYAELMCFAGAGGYYVRVNQDFHLVGNFRPIRQGTPYIGLVNVLRGFAQPGAAVTLTDAWQDIIFVAQRVPAGQIHIVASVQYQCTARTANQDEHFRLVVDGTQVHLIGACVLAQWQSEVVSLSWIGSIAAGSKAWSVQAKKADANNTVVATAWSAMTWMVFA